MVTPVSVIVTVCPKALHDDAVVLLYRLSGWTVWCCMSVLDLPMAFLPQSTDKLLAIVTRWR